MKSSVDTCWIPSAETDAAQLKVFKCHQMSKSSFGAGKMLEMKEPPASSDPRILPDEDWYTVHRCPRCTHLKYCQVVKLSFYSSFLLFRPACPRLPGQYLSKGVVIFAKFRPGVANQKIIKSRQLSQSWNLGSVASGIATLCPASIPAHRACKQKSKSNEHNILVETVLSPSLKGSFDPQTWFFCHSGVFASQFTSYIIIRHHTGYPAVQQN